METQADQRADAVFRLGPETAAMAAESVAFGQIADLQRQITEESEDGSTPLQWIVRAHLVGIRSLKGPMPAAEGLAVERVEQGMARSPLPQPWWLARYGLLEQGGDAVLFSDHSGQLIVPSGPGEQDLAGLVERALRIADISEQDARRDAALDWLAENTTAAEREAATRMAVRDGADWAMLQEAIRRAWPTAPEPLRLFFTGMAAHGLKSGIWSVDDLGAVVFLCDTLSDVEEDTAMVVASQIEGILAWSLRVGEGAEQARERQRDEIVRQLRKMRATVQSGELVSYIDELLNEFDTG